MDINQIYEMLNFNNTQEIQLEGEVLAKKIRNLSLLIQPPAPPSVWEHCAKVLSEKSDAELEPYLKSLLEWLQDINWPGALIILDRLKLFSEKSLKNAFIECYSYASSIDNEEGLMWIDYLSELLDNEQLKVDLPKEMLDELQKHYHNWGFWYSD